MGESAIQATEEEVAMRNQQAPICAEHRTVKEWRTATFEHEDDGITIRVPNLYAWCVQPGEKPHLLPKPSMSCSLQCETCLRRPSVPGRRSQVT